VITLDELKQKLIQVDEVTLLETLDLSSEDIVNRFTDVIENNYHRLSGEFDETTPWDND